MCECVPHIFASLLSSEQTRARRSVLLILSIGERVSAIKSLIIYRRQHLTVVATYALGSSSRLRCAARAHIVSHQSCTAVFLLLRHAIHSELRFCNYESACLIIMEQDGGNSVIYS